MLRSAVIIASTLFLLSPQCFGQLRFRAQQCPNGQCQLPQSTAPVVTPSQVSGPSISIAQITPEDSAGFATSNEVRSELATAGGGDHFEQVIEATCRITVSGVCGSGTVVGRDRNGRALILTNAHVAGTTKGRVVNVERWNTNGQSERSTAAIIASGYGRGMSLDFAVLRAAEGFAANVKPVPMANRQPDTKALITTYGCPRCEWPSLQVLKMNRSEGQILRWHPEAIGGRSGSSVIDYTANGPEVVGLLTWGGGGEGLGQSMPFVLAALQGRLPKSLESLPPYAKEVGDSAESPPTLKRMAWPPQDIEPCDDDLIEDLTGGRLRKPKDPAPEPEPEDGKGILRPNPGLVERGGNLLDRVVAFVFGAFVGLVAGYLLRGRIAKWVS